MKFCSNCGKIISKNFRYCPHCGNFNKKKLSLNDIADIPLKKLDDMSKEKVSSRLEYLEILLDKIDNELTQFLSTRSR